MSYRDWLHKTAIRQRIRSLFWPLFAVVMGFVIGASLFAGDQNLNRGITQGEVQQQRGTANQPRMAPSPKVIDGIVSSEQKQSEPEKRWPECNNPDKREEAELCVQRSMAKTAEQALEVARSQNWIGGIGAALVALSLLVGASAAIYASVAAGAARETVEVARKAHITEQRPWIAVRAIRSGDGVLSADLISAFLWIRYTNIGKTPATVVIPHAVTYFRSTDPSDIVQDFVPKLEEWGPQIFGKTLVPGDWFEIGHNVLIVQTGILERETAIYKSFLQMKVAIGATYNSTLSDNRYHSVRSYMVTINAIGECRVAPESIEFYELDRGSDFV